MRNIYALVRAIMRTATDFVLDRDASTDHKSHMDDLFELLDLSREIVRRAMAQREAKKQQLAIAKRQYLLFQEQSKLLSPTHDVDHIAMMIDLQLELEGQIHQLASELQELAADVERKQLLFAAKKQEIIRRITQIQAHNANLQIIAVEKRIREIEADLDITL